MAAHTSARREVDTIALLEAANHRESASAVVHDVRNPNFPFLMPGTASKGVTRRFYDISMP